MPTASTPTTEVQARANALAAGVTALDRIKPTDADQAEAIAVRLAEWIMTGNHPDVTQ